MSGPTKNSKEKIERLTDLEPYNTVKINLLLDKTLDELNLMITKWIKVFNDVKEEILTIKEKKR